MKLQDELLMRKNSLEKALQAAKKVLDHAPEGSLRISKKKTGIQFYHVTDPKDTRGRYIRKEQIDLVKRLAAKSYATRLQRRASRELRVLNEYLKIISDKSADRVFDEIGETRRKLVTPILLSESRRAEIWMNEEFVSNSFRPEEKKYETRRGELVRSKSELLIANMYAELGIPYRYENELVLKDGGRMIPDFTLFDTRRRRLIYHEHFGMMDDETYWDNAIRKIERYQKNGIFLGINLIATFEGRNTSLNMRELSQSILSLI